METLPQIQTIIDEYASPISTVIEAPWVTVTSVNGMTGDVVVEIILGDFQPNHYYKQNTAVIYQGSLYYAKQDFTSGSTFNVNDWNIPQFTQTQADWNTTDPLAKSYIKNKPTKVSDFTNDSDFISTSAVDDKLDPINSDIETLDGRVSGQAEDISKLTGDLETTNTSITELKTDGSVVKLGTTSTGNAASPIYWNSGQPATCSTSGWPSIVTTSSAGETHVGKTLSFDADSTGSSSTSLYSSGTAVVSQGRMYRGSTASGNEYITRGELGWALVASQTLTSTAWGEWPLGVVIPSTYQGDGNEYKVVLGIECQYSTGLISLNAMSGGTASAPTVFTNGRFSYMKTYNGSFTNSSAGAYNISSCAFEWYMDALNDSCTAEVLVSRASGVTFWTASGHGGGISNGWGSAFCGATRFNTNSPITGFVVRNISTSNLMDFVAGSHIEVYARHYGV